MKIKINVWPTNDSLGGDGTAGCQENGQFSCISSRLGNRATLGLVRTNFCYCRIVGLVPVKTYLITLK